MHIIIWVTAGYWVGHMAENQFRVGLVCVEWRLRAVDGRSEGLMPQDLMERVAAAGKEFFGFSQSSEFTDQNNPLSEIISARVSAARWLTRERAGFEVRDYDLPIMAVYVLSRRPKARISV